MGRTLDKLKYIGSRAGIVIAGLGLFIGINYLLPKKEYLVPRKTQTGYVDLTKFNPYFKDKDEIKGDEVYVEYEGRHYKFIEDKDGNPVIVPYVEEEKK